MNILGLFLFHDHGHGGHSHGHEEPDAKKRRSSHPSALEEGRIGSALIADESGNVEDVLPENRIKASAEAIQARKSHNVSFQATGASPAGLSPSHSKKHAKRRRSRGYSTLSSDISVHPASLRNNVIAAGRLQDPISDEGSENEEEALLSTENLNGEHRESRETTPLLSSSSTLEANSRTHASHHHSKPKSGEKGGHGHSHGDLNMRAVFLHVLGDALGNIGVIATALFIWLTPYKWRFYADPVISLVITVIIMASAVPLCMAASRILLQAVPTGLSVDEIKADILSLNGIDGCHHLHVWQLSDTKLVASLHIRVRFDFKGEGSQEYMELARQVRSCLHGYGIHSSTIQPEFLCKTLNGNGKTRAPPPEPGTEDESCSQEDTASEGYRRTSAFDGSAACLLDCDDECGDGGKCCGDPPAEA
jgi:zinc transporter 1